MPAQDVNLNRCPVPGNRVSKNSRRTVCALGEVQPPEHCPWFAGMAENRLHWGGFANLAMHPGAAGSALSSGGGVLRDLQGVKNDRLYDFIGYDHDCTSCLTVIECGQNARYQ